MACLATYIDLIEVERNAEYQLRLRVRFIKEAETSDLKNF